MHFTLSFFIGALAAFAAASPIEQNTNVKSTVKAKCFSGCGPSQDIAPLDQATWGQGYQFGNQQYTSIQQVTQSFQSFGTISTNTFSQWQSGGLQSQQISYELHAMVIQFQAMTSQFSNTGGCGNICDPSNGNQLANSIIPVFQQFQSMISIIIRSYSSNMGQFQSDFNTLQSCLQVVVGLLVSLRINVSSLLSNNGIDLKIFATVGINIQSLLGLNPTQLSSGNGLPPTANGFSQLGNGLSGPVNGFSGSVHDPFQGGVGGFF